MRKTTCCVLALMRSVQNRQTAGTESRVCRGRGEGRGSDRILEMVSLRAMLTVFPNGIAVAAAQRRGALAVADAFLLRLTSGA